LQLAERFLRAIAALGKSTVAAWWLTILVLAPLLGSVITEPAAMIIGALLLARQFYSLKPTPALAYATLGLLFANVSVGGTLTHFAAPPVLMVAAPWGWDTAHMFANFGWRAIAGIIVATGLYYVVFRKQFAALQRARDDARRGAPAVREERVPPWITAIQIGFMALTVLVAHYPPLLVGTLLFFLAFAQATAHHQGKIDLKPPLLVGFFLAGLVIHGGLQGWWIEPVLTHLHPKAVFFGAVGLGAVNDNAAITYLATLVPNFDDGLKYAIVAGAVTSGGLTVIANAPNPAGQSILARFFPDGISPLGLFLGALVPTAVLSAAFLLL
jgi:Na+/H+ antiporter NhaD/arsenite permease-like protein